MPDFGILGDKNTKFGGFEGENWDKNTKFGGFEGENGDKNAQFWGFEGKNGSKMPDFGIFGSKMLNFGGTVWKNVQRCFFWGKTR